MDNKKNNKDDKIIIESDHYDRQYLSDDDEALPKKQGSNSSNNKKKKKKKKKKNFLFYLKWFFIIGLILAIIASGIGFAIASSWVKESDGLDLSKFEYMEPSYIADKDDKFYQELQGKEKRDTVDIEEIPDMVKNAFIDIEDERFYTHNGVDIQGTIRAGLGVITSQSLSGPGGSTITQQLIKLTHLTSDKKLKRKVVEMYLAIQLERQFTKDQILEAYLNKIGFANAWGVQAASRTYFDKDVDEISIAQAAVLASIIKSPTSYKPYLVEEVEEGQYEIKKDEDGKIVYNEKNQNRALAVVRKMKELGHISNEDFDIATEQLKNNDFGLQEPPDTQIYSYFTDELYTQLINDLMESENFSFEDKEEAEFYLLNSGLKINSTIDPKVQNVLDKKFDKDSLFPKQSSIAKQASNAMSKELDQEVNYTPEAAMTVIDNSNGHVVGMIGGRDKQKSRSLNRATQKFQVGSATKPLTVYGPGLESKTLTLGKTYDDVPISIGKWKPKNAGGGYNGMTTIREGLRKSKNTVAAQAWIDVGLENSVKYGKLLGLKFVDDDMGAPALALGGYTYGQTTLDMASAFSTFATEGTRNEPILYTTVEDRDGNTVLENKQEKIRVFSEQTAYLITDVLKDVVRGGTTSLSVSNMQIAGKTGTTNDNMHAYFTGYTPYYTAAVWYGYDQNKVKAGGKTYYLNIGLSGGSRPVGPASMWQEVMREIHKGLPSKSLPGRPSGIVTASIDSVSGKLPTELTSKDARGSTVISEMFISGTVPTEKDDFHVELSICTVSGKKATEFCPESTVEIKAGIIKPLDRFPRGVKPLNANYVPNSEKSVLISDTDDVCDIHTADSIVGIEIFQNGGQASTLTLEAGQSTTIQVRGFKNSGEFIDSFKGLSVASNNSNVSVTSLGGNAYTITGTAGGNSVVTATVTYEGKAYYKDTINITVNQTAPPVTDPEDEDGEDEEEPPVVPVTPPSNDE